MGATQTTYTRARSVSPSDAQNSGSAATLRPTGHARTAQALRRRIGPGAWKNALIPLAALLAIGATHRARAAQIEPKGQVAPKLASGSVVFCVTHDAIVVAAVQEGGKPGALPPSIVPIRSGRFAVVLGADEWTYPDTGAKPVHVDTELPRVTAAALAGRTPANMANPDQPSSIEDIGVAVLQFLRPQVDQIHSNLDLGPDDPLVTLLLADYAPGYGPEIWSLEYRVHQEDLGNNYWETRILRPAYFQLYPPEKGRPRTFLEVRYPANPKEDALLTRLNGGSAQIQRIVASSEEMTQAIEQVRKGDSPKVPAAAVAEFLRAALPVVAGKQAQMSVAQLDERSGFQWIVAPRRPITPPPNKNQSQEPEAPSLRNYSPPK